ncbi:hypothetical protein [Streptococcus macacae]|uniref:Lipoprotein n=1 Tax=Streptococcus macacae NCTC 11558 TaxID=764298 RepID=G5JXG6_9STRE|nr:hypothetical protein [Streptococcus macacae]EHJ53331.1 putative lipoprotein [Streptococcus macacae NCTC 11558]SUN79237.1 membrane protein [Streptococcus macacae NCTC 11558]
MKKGYIWYLLLAALACYFIVTAFFPALHLVFNTMLILAIAFILMGLGSRSAILAFIGLGFLSIYLKDTFHFHYSIGPLFAGLVLIGVIINGILKPRYSYHYKKYFNPYFEGNKRTYDSDDEANIYLKTLFSENMSYITSQQISHLFITTKFGGQYVDLSQAQFMTDSPEIHLDVSFADTTIRIPSHWKIINKASSPFATISFSGYPSTEDQQITVLLTGTVAMGTVNIQY